MAPDSGQCNSSMAVVAAVRSALFAPGETNVFCGASNGQFCFKGEIILPGLDSTAAYPPRGSRRTRFKAPKKQFDTPRFMDSIAAHDILFISEYIYTRHNPNSTVCPRS